MMNCTELDIVLEHTREVVIEHPVGVIVAVSALLITGVTLLTYGERIIRPAGAVIGGVATLIVSFATIGYITDLQCEVRMGIAGVLSVIVALAISCILKSGVFLVGAAGLAAVTHLVYDALPHTLTQPTTSFQLMDRSGYYYIAMSVAVVAGGILAYTQRKKLMRIMSSAVGGGCIVLAIHLVWIQATDTGIPSIVALIVLLFSTVTGAFLQHYMSQRRHRRPLKRRRRGREYSDDDPVPVGVPVE